MARMEELAATLERLTEVRSLSKPEHQPDLFDPRR